MPRSSGPRSTIASSVSMMPTPVRCETTSILSRLDSYSFEPTRQLRSICVHAWAMPPAFSRVSLARSSTLPPSDSSASPSRPNLRYSSAVTAPTSAKLDAVVLPMFRALSCRLSSTAPVAPVDSAMKSSASSTCSAALIASPPTNINGAVRYLLRSRPV